MGLSNFDEALVRFHLGDLEYAGGLANHGPMGAEALERLGHQALIPAFLGLYAPRIPMAKPGTRITEAEEPEALGELSRAADWVATFEGRLEQGDWRRVVTKFVPPLIPGLFAGAGHGFLRVAHAVRSLEIHDSRLRRNELARGLAYWSARFQTLPGRLGIGTSPPIERLESMATWPLVEEVDARQGFFFQIIRRLDRFPVFSEAIEDLALPRFVEFDEFLSHLGRVAASLYLDHPSLRMAYVHALTIPSAARLVAPYLREGDACRLGSAVFQATAALHSLFGTGGGEANCGDTDPEIERVSESWDEIRYHAASSLQEHAIKMAEACWREDQIRKDPVFRRAAADAALKIDGRGRAAEC
jgi:hypothetical protein